MLNSKARLFLLIMASLILLVSSGVAVAAAAGMKSLAPLRLPAHYSWDFLVEEANTMNQCVECHDSTDYHTCAACHDDHGAIEMAGVRCDQPHR